MKATWLGGKRQLLIRMVVVIIGLVSGTSVTFVALALSYTTQATPLNTSLRLSATSGPPGTHIVISGSGYTPGEAVQLIWNYGGSGTVISERSFYYYNPNGTADANGAMQGSLFVPLAVAGNYTIAAIGAKSQTIGTATFQLVPALDLGIYIGSPGTPLRLNGWGFGHRETVSLYWNWTPTSNGQLIGTTSSDSKGSTSLRTFAVPAGTSNGSYTVAGIGSTSHAMAQGQFTVGVQSLGSQPGASDWADFGYDLQGTRVNPTESTIGLTNVSTLAVKWKSATPEPYKVTGTPLVANGIVYVGTIQGSLVAFDAATGNTLWTFNARGPIYGSPTIQNGIAYFGSVNYPSEDLIGNFAYALDAASGSLIWEDYLPYGGEWNTPLVSNGRVFFGSAHKEGVSGGFSAFDAYTGATLWSVSTPYGIWAPDTLDPTGTNLYVGTGNPCFTQPTPTTCGGYLEDLNPATGAVIWQIQFPDTSGDSDVPSAPTYSNGVLYLGLKNGRFYSVDATNGTILWQYDTGHVGDAGIFSSAVLYNNTVFFGGGDNTVYALNASNGVPVWTFATRSSIVSSPVEANGVLYIGSGDKNVYAFDPSTGSKLWSFTTGASVWSSPTISNGVLYVSGGDGYVYAFSPGGV